MKRNKNFERELPPGYKQVMHINAKNKGTAFLLSLGSLAITAVVFILLMIPLFKSGIDLSKISPLGFFRFYGTFILYSIIYIVLHELTHLPVIVDPSHATGASRLVAPMSMAAVACGADGLMIEVHNDPKKALCDGPQSLTPAEFASVMESIRKVRAIL